MSTEHTQPAGRSNWRRGCLVVLLLGALVLGYIGWEIRWALTAKPGSAIDYWQQMADAIDAAQPGTVEGYWEAFGDASATLDKVTADFIEQYGEFPPVAWDETMAQWPFDLEVLRPGFFEGSEVDEATRDQIVARALEAMAALDEAGYFRALGPIKAATYAPIPLNGGPRLSGILLPHLAESRRLARTQASRMWTGARAGDVDAVVDAFELNESLARADSHQPILICALVGNAVAALNCGTVVDLLEAGLLDEAMCRGILDVFDRQPLGDTAASMKGERLFVLDVIQATHTDNGNGGGRFLPHAFEEEFAMLAGGWGASGIDWVPDHEIGNLATFVFPSRQETTELANELYADMERALSLGEVERAGIEGELEERITSMGWRHPIPALMVPAIGRAGAGVDRILEQRAATQIMLAIEIHKRRTGSLPASLDELASILGEVPVNPRTGKAFPYRVLAEGEAAPDVGKWHRVFGGYVLDGETPAFGDDPAVQNVVDDYEE